MLRTESINLRGYIVGPIWQPYGAECWKDISVDLQRERARFSDKPDLRCVVDHVLMEQGGDFQNCAIAAGEVTIVMSEPRGRGIYRTAKTFPLARFPSCTDFCHPDPDWLPTYSDDE